MGISLRTHAETHVGLPMQFPLSFSDFIHKFEHVYKVSYNMSCMRTDGETDLLRKQSGFVIFHYSRSKIQSSFARSRLEARLHDGPSAV